KNTNIEDAVELTKGDIEPRSVTSTLEPIALFKYSDRTALPYPNIYYYWVKRDEGKLDPDYADPDYGLSNMAKGGLGKPNDGWLPIVDFIADDFDVSEGVTVVGKPDDTRSGSTFNPASPEFILDSGNSLDDSGTSIRFSAKISFDVDLEDYAGQEVQLNFDYKFKNLTDRSYLVALVDGKQVYAAKASESSSDWMGSNLIDITAQASGKKVTVVIGLVPDYLLIGAGLGDDQQLHLRNVKVGEKNYGPRWELLSIPSDGSINNILPNSVTSGNNIYSWNYAEADYNMGVSSANLALDPGVGYWILSTTPLTTENKILSSFDTTPNNVLSSKLAQVKTGWNLVGPVKKTFLRSGSAAGNSPVAYLNNYFGTNLVTGTAEEPVLNCQIWFWNPQVKQYQPVQDELNVGDAYWIFKF
ncbi:MAG: hypothetical protein KAG98_04130, partial [Lentisphaeria bacterium]|nr:hypothetical protein [Lentisphaeria bacterium]